MGWCIGILLLIVGFVLFMIPGSQTIGWILWMAGIVCFGGQGFINYRKSSNPTEGMAASSLRKDEDHTENAEGISKEVDNKMDDKKDVAGFCCQCGNPISADDVYYLTSMLHIPTIHLFIQKRGNDPSYNLINIGFSLILSEAYSIIQYHVYMQFLPK